MAVTTSFFPKPFTSCASSRCPQFRWLNRAWWNKLHTAAYSDINRSFVGWMFYFFFESRGSKADDPVVLWMTGGPGCSSEWAVFYKNGPFKITDNLTLVWNEYGWDKASNIIFVDQPTGTGFSYNTDVRDLRYDEKGVSNDMYDFLQELLFFLLDDLSDFEVLYCKERILKGKMSIYRFICRCWSHDAA